MRQRVAIARAFATDPSAVSRRAVRRARRADARDAAAGAGRLCARRRTPVTTVMITNSVEEAILLSDRIVPMTPGPPATLGTPIPVELPRPRSLAQLAHDEQATHVRAHVVATLTASVRGRTLAGGAGHAPAPAAGAGRSRRRRPDERSARAHRPDQGLPDADGPVHRRQGRQRRRSRRASSSRSSATRAAASPRCCRSSPGSSTRPTAASSSTARRSPSPAPSAPSSFSRPACCRG